MELLATIRLGRLDVYWPAWGDVDLGMGIVHEGRATSSAGHMARRLGVSGFHGYWPASQMLVRTARQKPGRLRELVANGWSFLRAHTSTAL